MKEISKRLIMKELEDRYLKIRSIKIGKKFVGEKYPCYIIAEIGSNFDGSLSKAKKLIRLAKESGADAAKFQSFLTKNLLSENGFENKTAFQSRWSESVWDTYRNAEFPRKWHKELAAYSKKLGIHFFTSPWDYEAVDLLEQVNSPAIKIGSGDITYLEILKYIGKKNKPILLATGASTINEINNAIKVIYSTGNKKIILMHSVTQYPSPLEEANLRVLETLKKKFKLNIGYSDHSPGQLIPLSSVAMGACVIEKHFTLDPNLKGPDHPHSMNPKSFKEMVYNIRLLEKALGDGKKKVENSEKQTRIIQRRGIWTVMPIKKGEKFSKNNLKALRPCIGISSSEYEEWIGKRAKKQYRSFEAIK